MGPSFAYLGTMQMRIFNNAHDGGEGHCSLIQGLDEVGENHNSQDALVDHPSQARVRLFVDFYNCLTSILGHLLVDERIVHVALLNVLIMDILDNLGGTSNVGLL